MAYKNQKKQKKHVKELHAPIKAKKKIEQKAKFFSDLKKSLGFE